MNYYYLDFYFKKENKIFNIFKVGFENNSLTY